MSHSNNTQRKPAQQNDRVIFQALAMALGTSLSRVLGLIRDMVFAAFFNRTITDAWGVAFRLPNLFRRLLGEGSLSISFVPVFIQAQVEDPTGQQARNLVNSFYTLWLLFLTVFTVLGVYHADFLVSLLVHPHFGDVAGKIELTVRFARVMFAFIFFVSSYAYFMGILNALGHFALPALAPALFNISMIIANFYPPSWQRVNGDALAWGVVIGGVLQAAILIPKLMQLGFLPLPRFDFYKNPAVARVFRNMIPGMIGMGLLQMTTLINTRFASSLGEGSNTYLYLADRLLELPLSLISVSLGAALLPTLATFWSEKNKIQFVHTANYNLRLSLFVAMPAAVGLFFLSDRIVEMLFMHGGFSPADKALTGSVVQIYSLTLLATSCARVVVPSYYAIKNTWFPAVVSLLCLALHLLLAPTLMIQFGLRGIVISSCLSALLNFALLLSCYQFFMPPFGGGRLLKSFSKDLVCCFGMAVVLYFYKDMSIEGSFDRSFSLLGVIFISGFVYLAIARVLKIEEAEHTMAIILEKMGRSLRRIRD